LSFVLHYPISGRNRLDRTIAGEQLGPVISTTTPRPLAELGGPNATVSLPIVSTWPPPTEGAVLSTTGIYPIEVVATDPSGTPIATVITHLLRLPSIESETNALAVGAVVRIGATPGVDPDRAPMLDTEAITRATAMFAVIDDPAIAPPITLAAEPFVIDVLRATGDAPALAPVPVDRSTLLTPYVDLDSGSLVAAGLGGLIDEELFVGAVSLTAAFDAPPERRVTVIDASVTPAALDRATLVGTTSVVVHSDQIADSVTQGGSNVLTRSFAIESADGSTFAAIASDDVASARLLADDPILGAHTALAELMMLQIEQPTTGRGVALALPADLDPATLRAVLSGLSATDGSASGSIGRPVLDPMTLIDLFDRTTAATTDGTTPIVRSWTSDQPTGLGPWPVALEQAQWDLDGLRSTLPDDDDTVRSIQRDLMTSAARGLDDPARSALIGGAQTRIRSTTSAITLPDAQTVTLTSSSGRLPLVITNELPTEARVRVRLDSPKLDFPAGTVVELVLEPSGTTRTDIEITTRASGAFPLDITISSANGKLPIAASRVTVRSTAISGWGLVLSIGAGLFLAVWWARHWRSSRRADLDERTSEPPAPSVRG
jgi:hypothetical protein